MRRAGLLGTNSLRGGPNRRTLQRIKESGDTKEGAFDIPGDLGREMLRQPTNVNGRTNADAVVPWVNGMDITRRPRDMFIVDFGTEMTEAEAADYEMPFAHGCRASVLAMSYIE